MYLNFFKRQLDLLFSILFVVLFWWVFVGVVALYAVFFQYPILFFHERIGKDQKPFMLLKFRTLIDSSDSLDKRRFLLGDMLRFLSLDELPQLWNVIKGEMSLIGPRPMPLEYLPLFSERQMMRTQVNPGITGWAQVNGRNSISWRQKFELDCFYVKHVSFRIDFVIFMKTLILLFSFKKDNSLTEEKFKGN